VWPDFGLISCSFRDWAFPGRSIHEIVEPESWFLFVQFRVISWIGFDRTGKTAKPNQALVLLLRLGFVTHLGILRV